MITKENYGSHLFFRRITITSKKDKMNGLYELTDNQEHHKEKRFVITSFIFYKRPLKKVSLAPTNSSFCYIFTSMHGKRNVAQSYHVMSYIHIRSS